MTTWGDIFKTLVACAAALFLIMAIIWAMETNMEIRLLQADIEDLKSEQRPLVELQGKYLTIFTQEKEVLIETARNSSQ